MSLFSKFASVGGATMLSRVLGFAREALIAGLLGAGPVADAFYAAFRFPNLFRRLFAEGAFNSAFVPLFSQEIEKHGKGAARSFAERVLSVLLVILLVLTALAIIYAPFLVANIVAPKFVTDPAKFELTVLLTRIMFPFLAAMSVVAMFSGILNAFRHYFLAALAPVILNLVLVSILLYSTAFNVGGSRLGIWLGWGVLASGLLQLALLYYGIQRLGFGLSLRMPAIDPSIKRLLVLALPTAIAGGITQINLLVGQIIASAQAGAIAIMNYADRLVQLPLGIIGISVGVVLLPELSRALTAKDAPEARMLQNRSLEFGLGLTIPAAIGLFMIPLPLVGLIYERGAFDRETSVLTAEVLAAFAIGLPSFVLIKIFQPAYYARQDMKTPMWFSAANAITNIVLSLILFPRLGVVGLAIATSVSGWINALLLAVNLFANKQFVPEKKTMINVVIICVASVVMASVLFLGQAYLEDAMIEGPLPGRVFWILVLICVSAVIYFSLVILSGAIPREELRRALQKKR